jgi:integrase
MRWARWDWLDAKRRVLTVQRSVCAVSGEEWIPKDFELRRLDVKGELVQHLEAERARQKAESQLGDFLLRGRDEGKPLSADAAQKAFSKMVKSKGLDHSITIYSLRHTYATSLLRVSDIRTVQRRLGHASLRTTESYLHEIEPEDHPTDQLPY